MSYSSALNRKRAPAGCFHATADWSLLTRRCLITVLPLLVQEPAEMLLMIHPKLCVEAKFPLRSNNKQLLMTLTQDTVISSAALEPE